MARGVGVFLVQGRFSGAVALRVRVFARFSPTTCQRWSRVKLQMVPEVARFSASVIASVSGDFLQSTRIFTRDSTRRSSYGVFSTSGDTDVCDGDRGVFRTREVERVHSERSGGGVRRRDEYERD